MAEASSNLARCDGVRYTTRAASANTLRRHVPRHSRRRVRSRMQAPHPAGNLCSERGILRRILRKSPKVQRAHIAQDYAKAFETVERPSSVPFSPFPAFKIGEKMDDPGGDVPFRHLQSITRFYSPESRRMSVPAAAATPEGLPVGLQIAAETLQRIRDVPPRRCLRAPSVLIVGSQIERRLDHGFSQSQTFRTRPTRAGTNHRHDDHGDPPWQTPRRICYRT